MADTSALKRKFEKMKAVARTAARDKIVKAAEGIASTMRRVGPHDDTYTLERSIRVVVSQNPKNEGKIFIVAGGRETRKPVKNADGRRPSYDYALAQEMGTQEMPATPFFWPVWRLQRESARRKVARAMLTEIKAEAARQGFGG